MKKSKKLLSVVLAILMIFSTMSVMASAYADTWNNMDISKLYKANDKAMSTALTDEERAAYLCDIVDDLLAGANIYTSVAGQNIDLRSINALGTTLNNLGTLLSIAGAFVDLGLIEELDFGQIKGVNRSQSDVVVIEKLLAFLDANAGKLGDALANGLSLGLIESSAGLDLSAIKDIPGLLKGMLYGLDARTITNGIGDDPAYPNEPAWADLTPKPTLDTIVQNLLVGLITEPLHTTNITDPSQNLICTNPEAYGATADMIHREADTGYYYIYAQKTDTGAWSFRETGTEEQKQYITHWDVSSALMPDFDTSLIDFTNISLYTLIAKVAPVIYDAYGQDGLNGKLRATLMQWCGAVNETVTDEVEKAAVKTQFDAYLAMSDADFAAALAQEGVYGTRNFLYFSLNGNDYYCVEWNGAYEFYKVNKTNVNSIFAIANWDYQIGTWDDIWTAVTGAPYNYDTDPGSVSFLAEITDIMGYIVKQALPTAAWTFDSGSEENAHFEENVTALIKQIVSLEPEQIFGRGTELPEGFANFDLEDVAVMIAKIVIGNLMPSLILPEGVNSIEEILVYGIREFIAEIMPEYSWDDAIDAAASLSGAAKEDAFVEVALSMGTSIASYYVRETLGYVPADMSQNATWESKLDGILEFVLDNWVPGLTSVMQMKNATVFNGSDPLDKLSIILNALFPTALTLVNGCSGTVGDGDNSACAVDVKQVYNLIRGLLNGEVEPIANKLYRHAGAGDLAVYPAIITLVSDLIGGLGANYSTDFGSLKGVFNTALATATPLETLVANKTNFSNLIKYLIWTLVDVDTASSHGFEVRDIWPQDALRIVIQLVGALDAESYNGATLNTAELNYYGSASASVVPTITINTKGLASAFYAGGYGTGDLTVDPKISSTLIKLEVFALDAPTVVITSAEPNATLTPNQDYVATALNVPVTADYKAYGVKAYYTISVGGVQLNNGEPFESTTLFSASSATKTEDTDRFEIWGDGADHFTGYNIYFDENTPFSAADSLQKSLWTNQITNRSVWLQGYGNNNLQPDGSYTVTEHTAGAGYWQVQVNQDDIVRYEPGVALDTSVTATGKPVPFYWTTGTLSDTSTKDDPFLQMWMRDATMNRSDFENDFTTLAFAVDNALARQYYSWGNKTSYHSFNKQPHIIMYNSYGLSNMISLAINTDRDPNAYTTESWAAYVAALNAALALDNMNKVAETFAGDRWDWDKDQSMFKTVTENLAAATTGLTPVGTDSEGSSATLTPAQKEALGNLKTRLDAEAEKGLDNKDFYAYRWWLYYNKYAELNSFYNATQAPAALSAATKYLAGVADTDVEAVLAATANDKYAAYINALVTNPTAEQIAANAEAIANFTLPSIDLSDLQIQENTLGVYASRLLEDGAYKYYLNDAIATVTGLVKASGAYTAQSYKAYTDALAQAQAVNANASAKPSEIHMARYSVLVAYNRLIEADNAADFTELNATIAQAQAIMDNADLYEATADYLAQAEGNTTTTALADLLAALGYKVALDAETSYVIGGGNAAINYQADEGKYEAKDQSTIDWVASLLKDAMANVECIIKAVPDDTFTDNTTKISAGEYIIHGIVPGTVAAAKDVQDRVTVNDPTQGTLEILANAENMFGTGATAILKLNATGATLATYTVVVYGDVNGDGVIDAFDTARMNLAVEGGVALNGAYKTAGGLTSGEISAENYATIKNAAVGAVVIAQ